MTTRSRRLVTARVPIGLALLLAIPPAAVAQALPRQAPSAPVPESGVSLITVDTLVAQAQAHGWTVPPPVWVWRPGSRELIAVAADPTTGVSWVEAINAETGAIRQLFRGIRPAPSPDGRSIAFILDSAQEKQLAIAPADGGPPRLLTHVPGGLIGDGYDNNLSFAWAPDGRALAYAVRARPPAPSTMDTATADDRPTAEIIERDAVPVGDSQLFIVDLPTGAIRPVPTMGGARIGDLSWFPDGRHLLFTANHGFWDYHDGKTFGEVHVVDVVTGVEVILAAPGGLQQALQPRISPDGHLVAIQYHADNRLYDFTTSIGIVADTGGRIRRLTGPSLSVRRIVGWAHDGSRIYFIRNYSPYGQIYSVDLAGRITQVTQGPRNVEGASASPDHPVLGWETIDARGVRELRVGAPAPSEGTLLVNLTPGLARFHTGATEELRWRSRDGLEIAGLLVKPLGYEPGKRYPVIVDVHGGGFNSRVYFGSALLGATPLEWHFWASKGYAVLLPEYRTSGAYGWRPVIEARNRGAFGDRDLEDILGGVDDLVTRGIADSTRLAILGHSAGAYRVNWAITHTTRFRVAVSYDGWAEEYLSSGAGGDPNPFGEWMYLGTPWGAPARYIHASPAWQVKGVKTPTLFISGDERMGRGALPWYHNEFMHAALRRQGVDTRLVRYRGEGHRVTRPANQRHIVQLIADWVDSHMHGARPVAATQ